MFEAFLAATMRGQALGQYFTPRSIVKMMTRLAHLRAGRGQNGVDRVLDACCGTGGFLIEALTEMRRQLWDNQSLSKTERDQLLEEVANQAIFGVDAGRDPMIARIARINMYLHGDGGSRVYMTDALRHPPEPSGADSIEIRNEVKELANLVKDGQLFDTVLTNPPFSMDYSLNVPEEREVLETYDLATHGGKQRASLRSSVMFIERYWQLLKPGGQLLTVIDDSVLSGKNYADVRDFIRERFIVRGMKPGVECEPLYLWSVLRSTAVIAEWMSGSSGVGRHRVDWDLLRRQRVPLLAPPQQKHIASLYREANAREAEITKLRDSALSALATLDLEGDEARDRLARAKPPK
jgi:type I restriction enzyme M protein